MMETDTGVRTILVVDDDRTIVDLMQDFLRAEGFAVAGARDAETARVILDAMPVDCVLLDVMMPGQSGFDLCRDIRATSDVPVLFLSARGEESEKIRGLGLGGDDYIVKTATPSEVVARVKAVLRRYRRAESTAPDATLRFGRLALDVRAHEVRVGGALVSLSPREYDLLRLLAEHPRQVFTYEQLLDRFWNGVGDRHTVTVHVERIRKKIEEDPRAPALIANVWGVGYRFEGSSCGG